MMGNINFDNEKIYLITMSIMKSLLKKNLVSKDEYVEIGKIFQEKYTPTLGNLFTEIY